MAEDSIINEVPLGKTTAYPKTYDRSLLVTVPRALNRDKLGLDDKLPFCGFDIWNAHELSWLNSHGLPQVAIAKLGYPCTTKSIVESKSFKLYLNSLNYHRFASESDFVNTLRNDLAAALQCVASDISISLARAGKSGLFEPASVVNFADTSFICIDDRDDLSDFVYDYTPELLLDSTTQEQVSENLCSHLLKSNCLITGQPDWGSVMISYQGSRINKEALLRYIVSFRNHNEFHEMCVERIFCDIMKYCKPSELTVYARYTRRGGLDINPLRSTNPECVVPFEGRIDRQ